MLSAGIATIFLCYTAIYLRVRKVFNLVKHMNGNYADQRNGVANSIISEVKGPAATSPSTSSKSSDNNNIEHQVLIMCAAMTAAILICWVPVYLVTLCETILQVEPPGWVDSLAYTMISMDVGFFTPIILIRFNKEYRKHWYTHVIPKSLRSNRLITGIYGEMPAI
jgi:hypothetical protein